MTASPRPQPATDDLQSFGEQLKQIALGLRDELAITRLELHYRPPIEAFDVPRAVLEVWIDGDEEAANTAELRLHEEARALETESGLPWLTASVLPHWRHLTLKSADFFTVADSIGPAGWEPAERSAVSRLHCGIHHEVRDVLERRMGQIDFTSGWDPRRQRALGSHEYVIGLVCEIDPAIAVAIDRLREFRVLAERRPSDSWSPDTRGEVISAARQIRRLLGTA
jgi:hypothetical protein